MLSHLLLPSPTPHLQITTVLKSCLWLSCYNFIVLSYIVKVLNNVWFSCSWACFRFHIIHFILPQLTFPVYQVYKIQHLIWEAIVHLHYELWESVAWTHHNFISILLLGDIGVVSSSWILWTSIFLMNI